MYRLFYILLVILTQQLYAQDVEDAENWSIGIGVSIGKDLVVADDGELMMLPVCFSNIHIPITVSQKLRFEPEFSIWIYSYEGDNNISRKYTTYRIGLGILGIKSLEQTKLHYGLRAGIVYNSTERTAPESEYNKDESKTDKYVGLAIGAEYYFSTYFSIGGEAQLNYIFLGNFDDNDDNGSASIISNRALVVIRFYFN